MATDNRDPDQTPPHLQNPTKKLKRLLLGEPKSLADQSIFHRLSLIPFLAWVGLGADGLSSSAYGPEEAFKALADRRYLVVFLAIMMAATVMIISSAYRKIIEAFPHGGGGYVVASKLLGRKTGVVSGCALLVDYVLTITVSIAAAGDALFSFLPGPWHALRLPTEILLIFLLTTLNLRGLRESVTVLAPIFIFFLVTHLILIGWGIIGHLPEVPNTFQSVSQNLAADWKGIGPWALFLLLIHAYSLGGGTYTGIEAVSNGVPIMREPRVRTAKITMNYMAVSLAITASGLLLCYLLWDVSPVAGKTLNAVLLERIAGTSPLGHGFVIATLLAEGLLLVVAAQAGFIDGPRVLANMAVDSWVPRRFASLSERLTTGNGILLMAIASLGALLYTHGNTAQLVVMYSINVFLTFSLSIFGMLSLRFRKGPHRIKQTWSDTILFFVGFMLCSTILVITVVEKFAEGGWLTLGITGGIIFLCFNIKSHYLATAASLHKLYMKLEHMVPRSRNLPDLDPKQRTAVVLVGGYGGLGIHTMQTIMKTFPGVFKNIVFISIGVVDSGGFKGEHAIDALAHDTESMLQKYVKRSQQLGVPATFRFRLGTDIVSECETLCTDLLTEFPEVTFFTGKIIFERERWFQRILHNETGLALQKRLQLAGLTMVILPARVT